MYPFELIRVNDIPQAFQKATKGSSAQSVRFVAGGTTLIDLMKLNVERPRQVIDINGLPLNKIELLKDGGLKIGSLVRNSDFAHHPNIIRDYPVLSQALLSGASAQLRNMATTGETCCKGRDAFISAIHLCHVTSANREAAVQRSKGSIER